MLCIRAYLEADEPAVLALWDAVFPEEPPWNSGLNAIRRKLSLQREFFVLAELDGQIVGTAMAGDDGYRGWVYYVAVDLKFRQKGIGKALMSEVEAQLRNSGCPQLNLLVRHNSIGVSAFYQKLGYDVEPKICMAKRL